MTDKEAIEILNGIKERCKAQSTIDIVEYSISALQEREERGKGCSFCKGAYKQFLAECFCVCDCDIWGQQEIDKINYCPVCGKPLKEEPNAE